MKLCTAVVVAAATSTAEAAVTLRFLGRIERDSDKPDTGVSIEVLKEESFKSSGSSECICPADSFWHYRIKECIKKGHVGYECGFFPGEHHESVCMDGLKCEKLANTTIKYFHAGAVPASCQKCQKEDTCNPADRKDCAKVVALEGESCVTVKCVYKGDATDTETESATAKAEHTAEAQETVTLGEGDTAVTKTASAKCTKNAEATVRASTTIAGDVASLEKTSCVKVEDALSHSGHSHDLKVDETSAKGIQETGKALALEKAMAKCTNAIHGAVDWAWGKVKESAGQDAMEVAKAEAEKEATALAKAKAEECAKGLAKEAAEAAAKAASEDKPAADKAAADKAAADKAAADKAGDAAATAAAPAAEEATTAAPATEAAATAAPATAAATTAAPATAAAAEAPTALLPGAPPKKIEPAAEPVIVPKRKVSAEEAAAELP